MAPDPVTDARTDGSEGRFIDAALERHKREGMEFAFRARIGALAVFAVMLPLIGPLKEALYYEALLVLLALVGWLQRRAAKVGRSRAEMGLIFADILIMTIAIAAPNPVNPVDWPAPMQFRSEGFKYFYIFLAFGTLAYSWQTLRGIGNITAVIWTATIGLVWLLATPDLELGAAAKAAFGHSEEMLDYLDPNSFLPWIRVQEIVVFLVVAWVLSTSVRRYSVLMLQQASLERERTNLARYFSPNVVEELSRNDEPLKRTRSQDIAVMFVDIVGFTAYAAGRPAEDVIETLRAFHARMEGEVFRHGGTLDKFLGDGLMATFGTPSTGPTDARDAFACAHAMTDLMAEWNKEREARGETPIRISIGLHYGPVVLGDIGANRLEFAVIGNTVNVASRVESLTRNLDVMIAATDAIMVHAGDEPRDAEDPAADFVDLGAHPIRGLDHDVVIWGWRSGYDRKVGRPC